MAPGAEIRALVGALEAQRRHVREMVDGLDEEALRRAVLPSGWTCLGLVRHLALDVERFWFRGVVAGEPEVLDWLARGPENAWRVGPEVPADSVLDLYRRETALADAVILDTAVDAAPAWRPEGPSGGWQPGTLRDVLLHVITETACHAGHLDAVRELIDGRKWLVLTD
ncbi:DinB family protein [Streptomyces polygonati]|uniref:DinB family protein n=1 Tax=Streptomyces polygonati TaxID=1617087 RepID=A0ABV8HZ36_9ACTN